MSIWTHLLFLHGHVVDPAVLAPPGTGATANPAPVAPATGWGVADTLALLGGRPMCAGHNFDVEDPLGSC